MPELKVPVKAGRSDGRFENLARIFDILPDMIIIILDNKSNIAFANRPVSKITNLSVEKIIGGNADILKREIPELSDLRSDRQDDTP